jgi:hypothetical protein
MQTDYIEEIQPTPKLQSKKCRFIAFLLGLFLNTTSIIISLFSWYFYDIFVGFATLLVTFIIMGIVRSKLRNSSIPLSQNEHYYSDMEIAKWYSAKELCDDILEQRLEKI